MWKVISPSVGRETAEVLESYLNVGHPIERDVKVNWGWSGYSSSLGNIPSEVWGNKREAIARSVNKRTFFNLCKDLGTVPVVKEEDEYAHGYYIHNDVTGHNGSGLHYTDSMVDALLGIYEGKLVTKEVKGQEFRVYFCYGMPHMMYAKVPLTDDIPHNPIQNSFNGYGYMPATPYLKRVSGLKGILSEYTKKVAARLELSYGAVDFIMDEEYTVYVLESNTAPTLFNETLCINFATSIAEVWNV